MSDFIIKWNENIRGTATEDEVKDLMDEIKRQALVLALGDVIKANARREVAIQAANGINASKSGYAVVDYCSDPHYDNNAECYMSSVMVAKNITELRKYLKDLHSGME